jgi:hypothetical protein
MNLEVDGTKKIILVEESQGIILNTQSESQVVTIGGVSVKGPQGEKGDKGDIGLTGVISAREPLVYNSNDRSLAANIGTADNQLVIGSDFRLSNSRTPSIASVTDASINNTLSQSKITNLVSDLSTINTTLSNKSATNHTHIATGDVTGTLGQSSANLTLANTSTARSNLGLGDSATKNVGTGSGNVASGSHTHTLNQITDVPSSNPAAALSTGTTSNTVATGDHTHTTINNFLTINGDSSGANALNALSANNKKIIHIADPIADDDVASKQYVDRVSIGIQNHDSVRLATTGAITLSGSQSIDGFAVSGNGSLGSNRILVKNQGDARENGIYWANTSGAWVRASDMSGSTNALWKKNVVGAYIYVNEGNTLANVSYLARVANTGVETIDGNTGDCTINFGKFSSLSINAGDGISISGPTISAAGSNSINVSNAGISVIALSGGGITIGSNGIYIANQSITNDMLVGNIQIGASGSKITGILPLANGGLAVDLSNSNNLQTARTSLGLGSSSIKDAPISGNASGATNANSQVVLANDSRLGDSRNPTGSLGGSYPTYDLTGNYPNPTLTNTGVSAGNGYTKFNVDGKGRITQGGQAAPTDLSPAAAPAVHSHVIRTSHNFIIQGNIVTSTALPVPPFFAIKAWGDLERNSKMQLSALYYKLGISTGTVTFSINIKRTSDSSVVTVGPYNASTTSTSKTAVDFGTVDIYEGDEVSLNISGISAGSAPQNLTVTIALEHTLN